MTVAIFIVAVVGTLVSMIHLALTLTMLRKMQEKLDKYKKAAQTFVNGDF